MGKTTAVSIDRMRRDDLDQVMEIEQASFTSPWSRNLFLAEFRNTPVSLMLVAHVERVERVVVGYIVCWAFVDELHILDLATKEKLRRQGIARKLVLAAIMTAYERGARKAYLEVRASNSAALQLYTTLGFERTQVRSEYYENPVEDAIVMTLGTEKVRRLLGISSQP